MKRRNLNLKKWLDPVINLIFSSFISLGLVHALTASLEFKVSEAEIMAVVPMLSILYSLVSISRKSIIISAFSAGCTLLTCFIITAARGTLHQVIKTLYSPVFWVFSYMGGMSGQNHVFEIYITVYLCILITLPVFIFYVKRFNLYVLVTGGMALFVVQWAMDYFVSYTAFYLYLFLMLGAYLKHVYLKWAPVEAENRIGQGFFLLFVMPFCALAVAAAAAAPASAKPVEWDWMDKKINAVYQYFNNRDSGRVFEYFSVASTGFGGEGGRLGGKVRPDRTPVLKVESPFRIYLKGAVMDYYTGSSWMNGTPELSPLSEDGRELSGDVLELMDGFGLISEQKDFLGRYFDVGTARVTYQNVKTRSLFYPIKVSKFNVSGRNPVRTFVDKAGNLSAGKMLHSGFQYSFDVYAGKYQDEKFKDVLRRSRSGLYEEFLQFAGAFSAEGSDRKGSAIVFAQGKDRKPVSFDYDRMVQLTQKAGTIRSIYLQLPEKLPGRVRELALSLASGMQNDYDRVKAIENYLSKNYPYTLSPGPTPRGRDFADYFLFDLKEGYCTYFATAMTVLVRCLGIPARYAEGYMLPPKSGKGDVYMVTNEQAHAWVEVYFEGFGWLSFEPTAPFRTAFYRNESPLGSVSPAFAEDPYYTEQMRRLEEYGYPGEMPNSPGTTIPDTGEEKPQGLLLPLLFSVLALAAVLGGIVLFNFFRYKLKLRSFLKAPPKESILAVYRYYLAVLSLQGLGIKPGETPIRYAERIDRYMFFKSVTFSSVTGLFMAARYSTRDILEEEKAVLCDFYTPFLKETDSNMGTVRFKVYRYLLGRI